MNDKAYFPIQTVFRHLERTQAIENDIEKHAKKLGQFFDHIMNCQVAIEAYHRHHKGNIYHVRIDLNVPHHELVVNRDPTENHAHEDLYVAIRDAFDAMKRQLQEHAQKLHGE